MHGIYYWSEALAGLLPWAAPVPGDPENAICTVCTAVTGKEVTMAARSATLQRHEIRRVPKVLSSNGKAVAVLSDNGAP